MENTNNTFENYLVLEIKKHEKLLEDAHKSKDEKRIDNNSLVIQKLREVQYVFEKGNE